MNRVKVIAISLWGRDPMFTVGVMKNIELAKKWYPGWVVRVYLDGSVEDSVVKSIIKNAEVVKMGFHIGCNGLFWRMMPLVDPKVLRFIVRDADSRIGEREALAVREWEESRFHFHIMRDHPNHNWKIMGGMWGAIGGMFPRFNRLQLGFFSKDMPFNSDQRFLAKEIWPKILNNHMAHDDRLTFTGRERSFPIAMQSKSDFIGNKYTADDKPVYTLESR